MKSSKRYHGGIIKDIRSTDTTDVSCKKWLEKWLVWKCWKFSGKMLAVQEYFQKSCWSMAFLLKLDFLKNLIFCIVFYSVTFHLFLKVQSCKLYINKYMIVSTQITNN